LTDRVPRERREKVFGISVLAAGFAIASLCLTRQVFPGAMPEALLPTPEQERFFFDLFGLIGGSWLLCWVSAVNQWKTMSRVGQWLGIILLCVDQSTLSLLWRSLLNDQLLTTSGLWVAPLVLQVFLLGYFFGFFTLPALTTAGNFRLTGLGTLMLLLPWLFGAEAVISGARILNGLFF
jgi:hypothetical protein